MRIQELFEAKKPVRDYSPLGQLKELPQPIGVNGGAYTYWVDVTKTPLKITASDGSVITKAKTLEDLERWMDKWAAQLWLEFLRDEESIEVLKAENIIRIKKGRTDQQDHEANMRESAPPKKVKHLFEGGKPKSFVKQDLKIDLSNPPATYREMISVVEKQYTKWYAGLVEYYASMDSDEFKKEIIAAYLTFMKGKKIADLSESVLGADLFTVTKQGDDSFVVGTKAKKGPILNVVYHVFKEVAPKKGVTVFTKLGKKLSNDPSGRFYAIDRKPNLVYKFENPEGAEAILKTAIDKATKQVEKDEAAKLKRKDEAPVRKKQAAAWNAEKRKGDMAEYDKKYGKGTWNRVTYKQEGGDDGYQYVLRVDGKALYAGMQKSEAVWRKEREVQALAKKEKLGMYADKA